MNIVYLSLGTNLGDKEKNLKDALSHIQRRIGTIKAESAFIETQPWGFESDNNFLNAAVKVETTLEPMTLLDECQLIEKTMGRAKKSVNGVYKDRIIDIDILMYYKDGDISGDGIHLNTPRLTIPHPLMNERDFVLIPLKQIL